MQIEFKDVKMRYRPGLPLVLKGLNVCIEAGTTCGVVGRTGKSAFHFCLSNLGFCPSYVAMPLVLKGLNVCIEAGTTCGVVGRTGNSRCNNNM